MKIFKFLTNSNYNSLSKIEILDRKRGVLFAPHLPLKWGAWGAHIECPSIWGAYLIWNNIKQNWIYYKNFIGCHYNVSTEITSIWGDWGVWGVYMKSPHFEVVLQRILYQFTNEFYSNWIPRKVTHTQYLLSLGGTGKIGRMN